MVSHVARASGDRSAYRATFAEGLASSYEAFLETRAGDADAADERALDAHVAALRSLGGGETG